MLNSVKSTLCISNLIWTTLDIIKVVPFNIEFHNVDQRWNQVVKMAISKKNQKSRFRLNALSLKF